MNWNFLPPDKPSCYAKDVSGHNHAADGKFAAAAGESAHGAVVAHKRLAATSAIKTLGHDESTAAHGSSKLAGKSNLKADHAVAQKAHEKAHAAHTEAAKKYRASTSSDARRMEGLHGEAAKAHASAAARHGIAAGTLSPSQFGN